MLSTCSGANSPPPPRRASMSTGAAPSVASGSGAAEQGAAVPRTAAPTSLASSAMLVLPMLRIWPRLSHAVTARSCGGENMAASAGAHGGSLENLVPLRVRGSGLCGVVRCHSGPGEREARDGAVSIRDFSVPGFLPVQLTRTVNYENYAYRLELPSFAQFRFASKTKYRAYRGACYLTVTLHRRP